MCPYFKFIFSHKFLHNSSHKFCIIPFHTVLNIGTASQLAVVKPSTTSASEALPPDIPESVLEVPYFSGERLLVAAAKAGGNVVALFIDTLLGWMEELGLVQGVGGGGGEEEEEGGEGGNKGEEGEGGGGGGGGRRGEEGEGGEEGGGGGGGRGGGGNEGEGEGGEAGGGGGGGGKRRCGVGREEKQELIQRVMEAGLNKLDTLLEIVPTVWGERHAPDVRGSVCAIQPGNLEMGDVSSAMIRGVVQNLKAMMPQQLLEHYKV